MRTIRATYRSAAALGLVLASCLSWARPAAAEIEIAQKNGWTLTMDGRFNAFFSYGFGDQYPQPADPNNTLIGGGGLQTGLQGTIDGKFQTTRIRNGFLGNLIAFGIKRNITDTTTMRGYMSIWSDIETNLTRYLPVTPDVREGYIKLEGPWGSLLAGRALGLYSRGSVEIDYSYMHGYGLGFPCNIDSVNPTCGMIGFGVLFPFFAAGMLYTTPSLGGLTLAVGEYDPVVLAGKWERVTYPRTEVELAWQTTFSNQGFVKVFSSGIWQQLGRSSQLGDTKINARKTVDVLGVAGGARFEIGPVKLGVAAHYGRGVGFYYAIENSPAAYYFAQDPTTDTRDGDLRTFSGYYGQAMVTAGPVDIAAGGGVSQLHRLSYELANNDLPKQQLGLSAGAFYHVNDYLVLALDVFRAQFTWWGAGVNLGNGEKQNATFVNAGMTMTF